MRLDFPLPRGSWPYGPARFLFTRQRRTVRDGDGIVTAFRDGKVTLRGNRRTEGFTNAVEEHGYQGIRRGDLVIHSMDAFAGAIGVSDSDGKASPVVHAYTPASGVDPRYYAYLLRSLAHSGYIESLARGIRERSTAFDAPTFASLALPRPPTSEQRAIADFLDAETARLDDLIAKKQRMLALVPERHQALVDRELDRMTQRAPVGPVGALCGEVVDCVNKTAPTVPGPTSFLMIRTSNVGNGHVDLSDVQYVDEETFRTWNRRLQPRPGDVLLTREAPVGNVGVLRGSEKVFLGQRLMLFRPHPDRATSTFLAAVLQSGRVQSEMALLASGSLHPHLRVGDCSKLKVPHPRSWQLESFDRLYEESAAHASALTAALGRQIALLREHRQALITAAVTGEFEVPGVAA